MSIGNRTFLQFAAADGVVAVCVRAAAHVFSSGAVYGTV